MGLAMISSLAEGQPFGASSLASSRSRQLKRLQVGAYVQRLLFFRCNFTNLYYRDFSLSVYLRWRWVCFGFYMVDSADLKSYDVFRECYFS
jgi:hypothetical protein